MRTRESTISNHIMNISYYLRFKIFCHTNRKLLQYTSLICSIIAILMMMVYSFIHMSSFREIYICILCILIIIDIFAMIMIDPIFNETDWKNCYNGLNTSFNNCNRLIDKIIQIACKKSITFQFKVYTVTTSQFLNNDIPLIHSIFAGQSNSQFLSLQKFNIIPIGTNITLKEFLCKTITVDKDYFELERIIFEEI